jgi:hypothetical protein
MDVKGYPLPNNERAIFYCYSTENEAAGVPTLCISCPPQPDVVTQSGATVATHGPGLPVPRVNIRNLRYLVREYLNS